MASNGYHRLVHGHQDLVLAVDSNWYGTRMVTASSDHRLRVWDRHDKTGIWSQTDVWSAHDAEVTDVKWNGPFVGEHIGSIGEDGYIRIWQEDVNEATNMGRRFKKVFERPSDTGIPYISFDFKNLANETYLAATTRDGHMTIFEPEDHDDLSSWRILWSEQLCKPPPRTDETAFRLHWHKEKVPAWPAVIAGLDRKSLSFAVSVGDTVRIYRSDKERNFYTAASLEGAAGLVRDVSWANGSMRGYDMLATASKDGMVRIYELHTPGTASLSTSAQAHLEHVRSNSYSSSAVSHPPARSGIGAGLAGGTQTRIEHNSMAPGTVRQDVKLVAEFEAHEGAPWRVNWSSAGDMLLSTGDDGSVQMWKKAIDGKWLPAAEVDATKDV